MSLELMEIENPRVAGAIPAPAPSRFELDGLTRHRALDTVRPWTLAFGELRARELPAGPPLVSTLLKVSCVMFRSDQLPSSAVAACEAGSANLSIAPIFCFSIETVPDPGTMARVLEEFVKRGLVPTRWHSDVIESDAMRIDIRMVGLTEALGQAIARCLRSIVGVESVLAAGKAVHIERRLRSL